jgi:hypothetical protein
MPFDRKRKHFEIPPSSGNTEGPFCKKRLLDISDSLSNLSLYPPLSSPTSDVFSTTTSTSVTENDIDIEDLIITDGARSSHLSTSPPFCQQQSPCSTSRIMEILTETRSVANKDQYQFTFSSPTPVQSANAKIDGDPNVDIEIDDNDGKEETNDVIQQFNRKFFSNPQWTKILQQYLVNPSKRALIPARQAQMETILAPIFLQIFLSSQSKLMVNKEKEKNSGEKGNPKISGNDNHGSVIMMEEEPCGMVLEEIAPEDDNEMLVDEDMR